MPSTLSSCPTFAIKPDPKTKSVIVNEDRCMYCGNCYTMCPAMPLAANWGFRESVNRAVEDGLPVYAECGGAIYLGQFLIYKGDAYAMAGVIQAVFGLSEKPRGHGYSAVEVTGENPFFPVGSALKGHEFHYAYVAKWNEAPAGPRRAEKRRFALNHEHGNNV